MRNKKGRPMPGGLFVNGMYPTPTRESVSCVSGAQYITGSLLAARGLMVITHGRAS